MFDLFLFFCLCLGKVRMGVVLFRLQWLCFKIFYLVFIGFRIWVLNLCCSSVHGFVTWCYSKGLYMLWLLHAPSVYCVGVPSFVHHSIWTTIWLGQPKRAFMTWYSESCWNLNHFYVDRWFIHLFRCSKHFLYIFFVI